MSSSRNSPSHRYHKQQQLSASSRSPSHSHYHSHSHSTFESPLALSPNPAATAVSVRGTPGLVDPDTSTAGNLTGGVGDFLDLTQVPRGSVRSARSFSSPSSSIGLTAGSSSSSPLPSVVYPGAGLGSGLSSQSRQRLSTGERDPRRSPGYQLSSSPVAVGSESYSAGNMTHDTYSYWQDQPSHPHLQPSSPGFGQSFSSSQSLSPDSFALGYNAQPGNSRSYYQSGDLSTQYLSVPSAGLPQGLHHPRSASMSYTFRGNSVTGNLPAVPDQPYMSSPSYFLNQSDYYFPDTASHSPHPSPIPHVSTPQPQTAAPPPLYPSSADSTPASTSASASASTSTSTEQERQVRVLSFRPKPQCWEHGCNGREFSTFSNLLRHQREKSGVVAKAECPVCGAAFTRTTARNIHVAQGKCKGGREFDG